jgi:hypothetical protein
MILNMVLLFEEKCGLREHISNKCWIEQVIYTCILLWLVASWMGKSLSVWVVHTMVDHGLYCLEIAKSIFEKFPEKNWGMVLSRLKDGPVINIYADKVLKWMRLKQIHRIKRCSNINYDKWIATLHVYGDPSVRSVQYIRPGLLVTSGQTPSGQS